MPTASLLCLVFVSDDFASRALHLSPDELRLVNATVALFAFICVLVQLVWKPDSREAAHANAVRYYINLEHDGDRGHGTFGAPGPHSVPPIREMAFIRYKRFHVRKLDMSRLLDEHPWQSLPCDGVAGWFLNLWAKHADVPRRAAAGKTLCTCGALDES